MKRILRTTLLTSIVLATAMSGMSESLNDQPAPQFELVSLTGESFNLADHRGRTIVLHFGTGW